MFKDRLQAAGLLAERLLRYKGQSPLVLAIPRGAAPMGVVLAQRLAGELDVVLTHKLCALFQPELAIGAIDESGYASLAPHAASVGATPSWITAEKNRQLKVLQERRRHYRPLHAPATMARRVVIVVDDGLATGATMVAALTAIRRNQPARLVCATPVASAEALELATLGGARVLGLEDEVGTLQPGKQALPQSGSPLMAGVITMSLSTEVFPAWY